MLCFLLPDTVYDLTILYMSDVTNWCEYLFDIFNPFEVYQQSEEITDFPTHESTIQNIKNSRVQVLIISPKFIETVTSQICDVTGKKSVVGLLCGVEEEELVRLKDRIPDYDTWNLVDAKDGPQKITQVTLDIVDYMIKEADKSTNQNADDDDSHYIAMTGTGKCEWIFFLQVISVLELVNHGCLLLHSLDCGAVVAQWIRPRTLNHEVPGSNLLAAAVVPLGKAHYPHCLVPRKGRWSPGCLLISSLLS